MEDIGHRVGIAAPEAQVYEALTTKPGLASRWTPDVLGEAQVGDR